MYLHISICSYNNAITDTIATYVMYQVKQDSPVASLVHIHERVW